MTPLVAHGLPKIEASLDPAGSSRFKDRIQTLYDATPSVMAGYLTVHCFKCHSGHSPNHPIQIDICVALMQNFFMKISNNETIKYV